MINTKETPLFGAFQEIIEKIDQELKKRKSSELNKNSEESSEEPYFCGDCLNIDNFEELLGEYGGQFHYTNFSIAEKHFDVKYWTNNKMNYIVVGMKDEKLESLKQSYEKGEEVNKEEIKEATFKKAASKIIELAKERLETAEDLIKAIAASQYDRIPDLVEDLKEIEKEKDEIIKKFKK